MIYTVLDNNGEQIERYIAQRDLSVLIPLYLCIIVYIFINKHIYLHNMHIVLNILAENKSSATYPNDEG